MLRLPELVSSPLSINALREGLQVSHKSVSNWLGVLERLYSIFRLSPFRAPRIRAVKKEQKHYHLDWSLVPGEAARFENLVACHLLKWVHFEQDTAGRELDLRYFRDVDRREVDFVVTERAAQSSSLSANSRIRPWTAVSDTFVRSFRQSRLGRSRPRVARIIRLPMASA